MFKYKLYALTSEYKEYCKTITRKNEMTDEQKQSLAGRFADRIAWGKYTQVILYGCVPVEDAISG